MPSALNVAHLAATSGGGANIAAKRLHRALLSKGINSTFYFGDGSSQGKTFVRKFEYGSFFWRNLAAIAISIRNRQTLEGCFFPSPRWIRKTPIQRLDRTPAIVHLHWVPRWLDTPSFFKSLDPSMPVVWTLHDLIPITGGCHYPHNCIAYRSKCGNCPQLRFPNKYDSSAVFMRLKKNLYSKANLHFVANSDWTMEVASTSALTKHAKSLSKIHYGLNIEEYSPIEKKTAREALRLPDGKFIVGFSCLDLKEKRKGALILSKAFEEIDCSNMLLLALGGGDLPQCFPNIQSITLGGIENPALQSIFYSALDVFAMPSLVETFGNAALEAMACGTPVICFPAGGLQDVVAHGETGLVEGPIGSPESLAKMIKAMRETPELSRVMGMRARERVIRNFSDSIMAESYIRLYEKLLESKMSLQGNP